MADVNVGQGQEVKYLKYLPQYMYILKKCPYSIPPNVVMYLIVKLFYLYTPLNLLCKEIQDSKIQKIQKTLLFV